MTAALSRNSSVHSIPADGHRLAGSNDGKLREAIHEAECFAGKVRFGVVAEHRGAVLETDLTHAHLGNGPDVFWYRSDSGSTTGK